MNTKAKARLGQQVDRIAHAWEPAFSRAGDDAFSTDLAAILAIVAGKAKAAINWLTRFQEVQEYMLQDANGNWQAQFKPSMEGVITAQAEMWEGLGLGLGAQFDVRNLFAEAWFDDYTLKFAQEVNSTTIDTLGNMFQQAQEEGWQIREMEENLETMFGQWMNGNETSENFEWYAERMPLWRRELIARTETMRSSNTGTFNLFEFWNVPMKEWNAVIDKRTRPGHAKAGLKYTEGGDPGPIPMSQPFTIEGVDGKPVTLMHPQALDAPVAEVANCRCSMTPFFKEWSEDGVPELESVPETGAPTWRPDMSRQEYNKWLNESKGLNPDLTNAERDALEWYKGEGYFDINEEMRDAGYSEDERAELIEAAIGKGKLDEPVTVYRGADWEVFDEDENFVGSLFEDDAFVSTSLDKGIASGHADGLLMEIRLPRGASALNMEQWQATGFIEGESEILLPNGSVFKVIADNIDDEPDVREMILELVVR